MSSTEISEECQKESDSSFKANVEFDQKSNSDTCLTEAKNSSNLISRENYKDWKSLPKDLRLSCLEYYFNKALPDLYQILIPIIDKYSTIDSNLTEDSEESSTSKINVMGSLQQSGENILQSLQQNLSLEYNENQHKSTDFLNPDFLNPDFLNKSRVNNQIPETNKSNANKIKRKKSNNKNKLNSNCMSKSLSPIAQSHPQITIFNSSISFNEKKKLRTKSSSNKKAHKSETFLSPPHHTSSEGNVSINEKRPSPNSNVSASQMKKQCLTNSRSNNQEPETDNSDTNIGNQKQSNNKDKLNSSYRSRSRSLKVQSHPQVTNFSKPTSFDELKRLRTKSTPIKKIHLEVLSPPHHTSSSESSIPTSQVKKHSLIKESQSDNNPSFSSKSNQTFNPIQNHPENSATVSSEITEHISQRSASVNALKEFTNQAISPYTTIKHLLQRDMSDFDGKRHRNTDSQLTPKKSKSHTSRKIKDIIAPCQSKIVDKSKK